MRETDESQGPSDPDQVGSDPVNGVEPVAPNDLDRSQRLRDEIKGVTTEHAFPPRLEDEGQSGG